MRVNRLLIAVLAASPAAFGADVGEPRTFCNPMPIPDMPVGIMCRDYTNNAPLPPGGWTRAFWKRCLEPGEKMQIHRELADPAVLCEGGTWYLYPSCAQMWVSRNCGGSWAHVPTFDVGPYAPAIAKFRGKYYLTSSGGPLYVADSPTGPFKLLGKFDLASFGRTKDPKMPTTGDAALLADGDRLYLYWGVYNFPKALWGVELDPDNPLKAREQDGAKCLMEYDERKYPWLDELVEGSWVIKRNGKYYLCYATGNVCRSHYAWCASIGDSPLGPFVPQKRNPFFSGAEGLITGTSHGSIYQDERGDWWINHCVTRAVVHGFERFIAQDRLYFEADGDIAVGHPTETPQWLPSSGKTGDTGWQRLRFRGNSAAADGCYATRETVRSFPTELTFELEAPSDLRSFRLIWRDIGYDPKGGVPGGPFRYRVDARTDGAWRTWVDRSANDIDLHVDYREGPDMRADAVRLVVLGGPKGITPAVEEFTVFGESVFLHPERLAEVSVPAAATPLDPAPVILVMGDEAKADLSSVVKDGWAVFRITEKLEPAALKERLRLLIRSLREDERLDAWLVAFVGSPFTAEEEQEIHQHPKLSIRREFRRLGDWKSRLAFLDAHGWRNRTLPAGAKVTPPGPRAEDLAFFERNVYGRRPVERPDGLSFRQVGEDEDIAGSIGLKRVYEISWPGKYRPGSFRVTVCTPRRAKKSAALVHLGFTSPDYAYVHRLWPVEEIILRGYAAVSFCYTDIAPDPRNLKHDGFTSGVYPCFERPEDRTDESWGAIQAWSWGASRVMDLLETLDEIDAKHVGVVGLSRLGKTALWTAAADPRFALACATGSGCEGASLNAMVLPGEDADRICTRFPWWFCGNFAKTRDGGLAAGYDQNRMIALIAPRAVFVSDSEHDTPRFADFEGLKHASPAWAAHGFRTFADERFPTEFGRPIIRDRMAFYLRHGFHSLTREDWLHYMDFADGLWGRPSIAVDGL